MVVGRPVGSRDLFSKVKVFVFVGRRGASRDWIIRLLVYSAEFSVFNGIQESRACLLTPDRRTLPTNQIRQTVGTWNSGIFFAELDKNFAFLLSARTLLRASFSAEDDEGKETLKPVAAVGLRATLLGVVRDCALPRDHDPDADSSIKIGTSFSPNP